MYCLKYGIMIFQLSPKHFNMKRIFTSCFILLTGYLFAQSSEINSSSKFSRFIPVQAKLQFAGNIGFFSAGAGYQYMKDKIDLDLIYGYVPEIYGGHLHTFTIKNTWTPFKSIKIDAKTEADLFTIGIPLSYTFGKNYFFLPPKDQYPKRYYDYSSALRIGIFGGGRIKYAFGSDKLITESAFYYELGTYDLMVHNYIFNIGKMKFTDLFSLGLGMQFKFGT